jgi:hypothetical protein
MWMLIVGALIFGLVEVRAVDVRVKPIPSSPGLHYQHQAEARLYSSEWRVVTYVDLNQASENVDIVGHYINLTIDFCNKHDKSLWLNLTECRTTIKDAFRKYGNLKSMRNLISQLTRTARVRRRKTRGLFNFIGQISHAMFGIMDADNEEFYNKKKSRLEEEESDLIKLSREQMIIVKSTLKSVNRTLHDFSKNELILEKGSEDMKKFINHENR